MFSSNFDPLGRTLLLQYRAAPDWFSISARFASATDLFEALRRAHPSRSRPGATFDATVRCAGVSSDAEILDAWRTPVVFRRSMMPKRRWAFDHTCELLPGEGERG